MQLSTLIIDPVAEIAQTLAQACAPLGPNIVHCSDFDEACAHMLEQSFDLVVLSLDMPGMSPKELLQKFAQNKAPPLLLATFRELAIPQLKTLASYGIDDFLSHPIDISRIFAAANSRFDFPFRRHVRHKLALPVRRLDGEAIGTTLDLCEGGLRMACERRVQKDTFLLVALELPEVGPIQTRLRVLEVTERSNPKANLPHAPATLIEACDGSFELRGQFEQLQGKPRKMLAAFLDAYES